MAPSSTTAGWERRGSGSSAGVGLPALLSCLGEVSPKPPQEGQCGGVWRPVLRDLLGGRCRPTARGSGGNDAGVGLPECAWRKRRWSDPSWVCRCMTREIAGQSPSCRIACGSQLPSTSMKIGYQGEARSYSHRAVTHLFPEGEHLGLASFASAFHALRDTDVDRLVLPIENSTTGSVLPVLDRLTKSRARIVGEHLVEVRHALIGVPGSNIDQIRSVHSHPQALAQADDRIEQSGWVPVPMHDTAGAVRLLAEHRDPSEAALAPPESAEKHGLEVLASDFMDRDHNTTRFVVLALEPVEIGADANKTSFVFATAHTPGALALSLTELGLRGANLTRLESRPSDEAWKYRFFADMVHGSGQEGLKTILEPQPATMADVQVLGTYRAAPLP